MGTKITELKQDKSEKIKKMREILDKADEEKRNLTDTETSEWEKLDKEVKDIETRIEKEEALEGREEELKQVEKEFKRPGTYEFNKTQNPKSLITTSRTFRGMFHQGDESISLDKADFTDLEEFLNIIASQRYDQRLEKRTFVEGSGVAGGFVVPEEYSAQILDLALESEIVRPRSLVFPMTSDTRNIPAWQQDSHTANIYGGFSGEWLHEGETATVQTARLRSMKLIAKKLAIYTEASREVLADGMALEQQLGPTLVKAIAYFLDESFLTGNGVGQPLGALNCGSVITVTRAGANAVAWADIYNMYSRLHPTCQAGAVWVINHQCLPQILNMTVNNNLIYIPGQFMGISGPVPATLLGKPVIMTEKIPQLGTKGDVMLADFSQYAIGLRQEVVVDRSNAPGWLRDMISFRAILRVDGESLWDKAQTPRKGADTLSWCVVLE